MTIKSGIKKTIEKISTLTEIKDTISQLRMTQKDILNQKKKIKEELIREQENLSQLSAMKIHLEDHLQFNADFIKQQEKELRQNIRNYLKGSKAYKEASCSTAVRDLSVFLRRFGQRSEGRNLYIPYVMVLGGSWKKLKEMVEEELTAMPAGTFGQLQRKERARKTDRCRRKIEELKKGLSELEAERT